MKKFLVAVIVCLFFYLDSNGQDVNCKSVRTGKFKLKSESTGTTIIKRTEKHQIEINKKYNYKAKFDVVWIDECTYELHNKKIIKGNEILTNEHLSVLIVEIVEVKKRSMVVKASSNYSDLVIQNTINILN